MRRKMSIICLALMLAFTGACSFGCGTKAINTPDHLEITVVDAGYGTEMMQAVANRFMELNEGKTVKINPNSDENILRTELPAGPSVNTTDMYLTGTPLFDLLTSGTFTVDGVTYDNRFLPLDDVYNSPATGETIAIKDKMLPEFEQYFGCDEEYRTKYGLKNRYYMAPGVKGLGSLIYNSKMFEKYGWEVPVTTDELIALCDRIIATDAVSTNKNSAGEKIKISPFIFSKADSYWEYVYIEWWAQYEGAQSFNNFFEGKTADGRYSADVAAAPGMLETLKVMDSLLGTYKDGVARTNVYTDPNLSTRTFIDVQATLLNGEGARKNDSGATTAAMMPNGDWIENEMYSNYGAQIEAGEIEFKMMKTPVISALANKTSFGSDSEHDKKLSELIKWIDGGKQGDKPAFATDNDVKTVEDARGMSMVFGVTLSLVVPAYTSSPDLAKDFLRFLYSDEGIKVFSENGRGISLPFKTEYDYTKYENISEFQKSKYEIFSQTKQIVFRGQKSPITFRAGLKPFSNVSTMGTIESCFNVSSVRDYLSPEEIFQMNYTEVRRVWARMMEDAGFN